ncbi:twin-arginine translocation signal domain-containing protein [Streptomyces oryzae]|uniref:Twin-arginine translocation signal domain-containing protein n=1 Tax=Streptomyces oryzae TaxID=1434886 RepID=A0ABS3XJB6_9ACTN|nr:twin-arginine translocation signal domain-containing protein [Streptomyces oryzae]MBO8195498.1 twin-arginine translocation signal domain-containing protein [Streptomyces oryzae]
MNINRRQLLRGSLAAAAAAGPLGALASPAYGAQQAAPDPRDPYDLVLLDVANKKVQTVNTGQVRNGQFGDPISTFATGGWDPLECRFREIRGTRVFMVCGGSPGDGKVTIHRQSDSKALGWDSGLKIFPHCIEYLPTADAVIVVGTRGFEKENAPETPEGKRPGGSYQLYTAPDGKTPDSFKRIRSDRFRQAHGVLWDPKMQLLWIYGGDKLQAFEVKGHRESTYLAPKQFLQRSEFENGHDLQPDYVYPQFFWATGTHRIFKIDKSGAEPVEVWSHPTPEVKSFSRHEKGRGIYTSAHGTGNAYGNDQVHFLWPPWGPPENIRFIDRKDPKARKSRIYKARLTNHELPGA